MIKAIYFDFDGVLTPDKNDGFTTCKNLSISTGIDYDVLYNAYQPYLERLYAGVVTNQSFWDDFCSTVGQKIDMQLLHNALTNTPKNNGMLDLAEKLKKSGYAVGVITNQAVDRYDALKDTFELERIFYPVMVSAQVGCTKRGEYGGEKIFDDAMKPHAVVPTECVFIDNSQSNLVIPKAMGFHTYYHDQDINDIDSFISWLNTLGVNITEKQDT